MAACGNLCAACGNRPRSPGTIYTVRSPLTAQSSGLSHATHSNHFGTQLPTNSPRLLQSASSWAPNSPHVPGPSPPSPITTKSPSTKDDPVAGSAGPPRQNARRRSVEAKQPPGPSSRRDHRLLPPSLHGYHRRQRGSRHHDPHRRLVGLSRRAGCRPRSPCHRSDRRLCGAAVDPPRLYNLKTWALGVYHGLRKKHLIAESSRPLVDAAWTSLRAAQSGARLCRSGVTGRWCRPAATVPMRLDAENPTTPTGPPSPKPRKRRLTPRKRSARRPRKDESTNQINKFQKSGVEVEFDRDRCQIGECVSERLTNPLSKRPSDRLSRKVFGIGVCSHTGRPQAVAPPTHRPIGATTTSPFSTSGTPAARPILQKPPSPSHSLKSKIRPLRLGHPSYNPEPIP